MKLFKVARVRYRAAIKIQGWYRGCLASASMKEMFAEMEKAGNGEEPAATRRPPLHHPHTHYLPLLWLRIRHLYIQMEYLPNVVEQF